MQARGVERCEGRVVKPEDNGNVGEAHAAREFPLRYQVYSPAVPVEKASPLPLGEGQGEGLQPLPGITQLELARAGIVTEEMAYIAHRENLGRTAALDRAKEALADGESFGAAIPESSRPNSCAARSPAAAPSSPPTSTTRSLSR